MQDDNNGEADFIYNEICITFKPMKTGTRVFMKPITYSDDVKAIIAIMTHKRSTRGIDKYETTLTNELLDVLSDIIV